MPTPRLAKLTRPRTEGLFPRTRLFEVLDDASRRPVVWVFGPPGAGKTSLVSSYLEARKRPCLWYQVDAGDADVATFFHYLGLASAERGGKRHAPLPQFGDEFAEDPEGFARSFFRGLFAQLGDAGVLVLDNYQEAAEDSALHAVVRVACDELPEGLTVCAVSRAEPPVALARLRANQRLALVGWEQLRLTAEETAAIASEAHPDAPTLALLCEKSGGWAAGVVLMLERLRQAGVLRDGDTHENLETIFEYFAGQVFHGATRETQEMLLRMAQLPRLTAETAQVVTGNPQAGKLLANLAKRNLFTDRRVGEQTSYQFHALFREFLRAQARERLGAGELQRVAHSAAALLQATGQAEEAFALFVQEGAWDAAASLILSEAQGLVDQGRRKTLLNWIEWLPAALVNSNGWMSYWYGVALSTTDATQSRAWLVRSHAHFRDEGNVVGVANAAVAVVDNLYASTGDLLSLDEWIGQLVGLLEHPEIIRDAELQARVLTRYYRALFIRQPLSEALASARSRLIDLLQDDVSTTTKLYAAGALLVESWILGHVELADRVIEIVDRLPSVDDRAIGAWRLYRYFRGVHLRQMLVFDNEAGSGEENPDTYETEIGPLDVDLLRARAGALFLQRRFAAAQKIFAEQIQPRVARVRTTMVPSHYWSLSICALGAGDRDEASRRLDALLEALKFGSVAARLHLAPRTAGLLAALGRDTEACELLDELQRDHSLGANPYLIGCTDFYAAYVALKQGRTDEVLAPLCRGLGALRRVGYRSWLVFPDSDFDRLFALALEHGIEIEFVTSLIREHGIPAPDPDLDIWPWPLRLRLLGGLRIEGLPGPKSGKSQRKLNELLTAIAVAGPDGTGLQALADRLWPDSEGDAALNALQVSLYRLRKMLGRDDAVQVAGAVVRLERPVCWVDAWAFEAKAAAAMALPVTDSGFEPAARQALAMYAGHLLAREEDAPWLLPVRDRLRRAWGGLALKLGEALEHAGRAAEAVTLYEDCLDRDPQAEALCRSLMRCHAARGDTPAVTRTFERCRSALAGSLGVEPAADTRRCYREALQEAETASQRAAASGAVSGL